MTSERGRKFGIIGLGGMGRYHAEQTVDAGHDVVAGTDVDGRTRDRFATAFDADAYADHESMLGATDLDAVVVTTPNRYHESATVAALAEDLPVLVEKPLAHDVESARRIVDAERRSGATCAVGFHNRFAPPVRVFREFQERGRFGDLTHLEARFLRRRGIPGPGTWFTDPAVAGGGAMVDVGVHALDLSMYLLGFPRIEEVTAVARSTFGNREEYADPDAFGAGWEDSGEQFDVEDSATALLRCAGGRTVSLEVSWAANRPPSKEVVARGTDAGARFAIGGDALSVYETGTAGTDHYADTDVRVGGKEDPHASELDAFVAAIDGDPPDALPTAEEALSVQRVVDAVYRSDESGGSVSVAPEPTVTH